MNKKIVVHSGPLIALFDKSDKNSPTALAFLKKNTSPLFTTLPVVTEVIYILDFSIKAQSDFLEWISRGGLSIINLDHHDFSRIKDLMLKYQDLPMDFADGSLVAACEKIESHFIATIDKDFEIYRFYDKKTFHNVFDMK